MDIKFYNNILHHSYKPHFRAYLLYENVDSHENIFLFIKQLHIF